MKTTAGLIAWGLLCGLSWGQASPGTASVEDLQKQLQAYRRALVDFGGMIRYGSANAELRPPAAGESRVVFFGDDITENWGKGAARFFPGKPYLNRGISRQTTPQMLVRFRQDVISLKPKVVVMSLGTNDIANSMGPGTLGNGSDHIRSMVELARANGIRVVLASVLPVCDCTTNQTSARSQTKIEDWNDWIKGYAEQTGSVFLDYYSALALGGNFKKELTANGFLPNDAGYTAMAGLAEKAIAQSLAR